jgi:hypothetical protein
MVVRAGSRLIKFDTVGQLSDDLGDHAAASIMAKWRGCFEYVLEPKKKNKASKGFLKGEAQNKMATAPENK